MGVFISDSHLVDWHSKMKAKMPQAFSDDDNVFGNEVGQHHYGTKLRSYFDDDPNKPMNCTVLGSRWQVDEGFPGYQGPFADNKEPMYIILINGELSQIGLMDAHMAEPGGWDVIDQDSCVSERYDALARAHQNCRGHQSSDEDSGGEDFADGASPRQTGALLERWEESRHGCFVKEFFLHCFSSSEQDRIKNSRGQNDDDMRDGSVVARKLKEFSTEVLPTQCNERNFLARLVIAQIHMQFATCYKRIP